MIDSHEAHAWIRFAETCYFDASALSERCGVSLTELNDFFILVLNKSLRDWLLEARLSDAPQSLCRGLPAIESDAAPAAVRQGLIQALHERVLAGYNAATETLTALLAERLFQWLKARFPKTPAEMIHDSVADAIMDYLRLPGRFDPEKGIETLDGFLRQVAWKKASNILRNERRRQEREQSTGQKFLEIFCQISPSGGELLYEDPMQDLTELLAEFWNWVESLNHADGRAVELWVSGERDLSTFARLLGLADRTPAEQRKAVNRTKNRLHKALLRWMEKLEKE